MDRVQSWGLSSFPHLWGEIIIMMINSNNNNNDHPPSWEAVSQHNAESALRVHGVYEG